MPKPTTDPGHASPTVAIIGAGRLGTASARALRAAGAHVIGPLGRGDDGAARATRERVDAAAGPAVAA